VGAAPRDTQRTGEGWLSVNDEGSAGLRKARSNGQFAGGTPNAAPASAAGDPVTDQGRPGNPQTDHTLQSFHCDQCGAYIIDRTSVERCPRCGWFLTPRRGVSPAKLRTVAIVIIDANGPTFLSRQEGDRGQILDYIHRYVGDYKPGPYEVRWTEEFGQTYAIVFMKGRE